MREVFDYTRRNVEDQPEGLEYVRAQDLYRQLRKRQESEGDDKIDIDAESLVLMDGAFRENPEFADEHTWTKEQLIEKVQKSHGVSSLEVIGFIGEEDPEKAKELLQGISDNINQEYKRLKRSKDGVRDYDGEREAYAFITQLETVANSIGGQEYVSEIYDMAGYEHPLEVTLHDREYKRHEIKILHLRAPELDVANADVAVENMAKYQEYFKQVIEPAEFLSGWNGVGDRYKFLADETNKALEGAVTVVNNHPESAMELRKLTETAITLNKLLHHEVVVPFSNIENVNTFSEVVSNEEVETNRPEHMEYELLNACIEARDPELVNQQLSNVFKVLDSIDQDLIDNPPISEWKGREQRGYYSPMWKERVTIEAYDELYEKIKVLGDSNPEFENIAKRAKERYETTLRSLVPDAHNKTVDIVERRLEEITEPSENWGETLELLHAFNNSNKVRTSSQYELKHSAPPRYTPSALLSKCVDMVESVPTNEKSEKLKDLIDLSKDSDELIAKPLAQALSEAGYMREAAESASHINDAELIAGLVVKGDSKVHDILVASDKWDFEDINRALLKEVATNLDARAATIDFFETYAESGARLSHGDDIVKIIRGIGEIKGTHYVDNESYKSSIKPDGEMAEPEQLDALDTSLRDRVWQLFQTGNMADSNIPHTVRVLIEDNRDESVISLSLSPAERSTIPLSRAALALESEDVDSFNKCIETVKKLSTYQNDHSAQQKVSKYTQVAEKITRSNTVNKLKTSELKAYSKQHKFQRREIIDALLAEGRVEDIYKTYGEGLDQKEANLVLEHALASGNVSIAEDMISLMGGNIDPVIRGRYALAVKYVRLGGDPAEVQNLDETNKEELFGKMFLRLKDSCSTKEEITNELKSIFQGTELEPLLSKLISVTDTELDEMNIPPITPEKLRETVIDRSLTNDNVSEVKRFVIFDGDPHGLLYCAVKFGERGEYDEISEIASCMQNPEDVIELVKFLQSINQNNVAREVSAAFVSQIDETYLERNAGEKRSIGDEQSEKMELLTQLIVTSSDPRLIPIVSGRLQTKLKRNGAESLWEVAERMNFEKQELESLLNSFDTMKEKISLLDKMAKGNDHRTSEQLGAILQSSERALGKDVAMEHLVSTYAAYLSAATREASQLEIRGLESTVRIEKLKSLYESSKSPTHIFLAASTLNSQEWGEFVQALPASERDKVLVLRDWYDSRTGGNGDAGRITDKSISRITEALASENVSDLRISLETLHGMSTPDASSKLIKVLVKQLESESDGNISRTVDICRTLSKMDSYKGNTILANLVRDENTPEVLARYIIRLLVENQHFDPELKTYFAGKGVEESAKGNTYPKEAVARFRAVMQNMGINPDSAIMHYVDSAGADSITQSLQTVEEDVASFGSRGEYSEQGEWLQGDVNNRLAYFMRYGGRTSFSLINDYSFGKFSKVLAIGNELETHERPISKLENSLRSAHGEAYGDKLLDRIVHGKFPLETANPEATWDITVDSNKASQVEQAKQLAGSCLGSDQLGNLVKASMYRKFLDKQSDHPKNLDQLFTEAGQDFATLVTFNDAVESHYGDTVAELPLPRSIQKASSSDLPLNLSTKEEIVDFPVENFETSLRQLGKQLINEIRQKCKQGKISKEERDAHLQELDSPDNVLPVLMSMELSDSFSSVITEWKAHIETSLQSNREARAMRKGTKEVRELTMRFLDKTYSLPEYLRFADSAQCCFTSKNFETSSGPQQYIARVWKDPMSFVFEVEDREDENDEHRKSVGFVFGSYGINRADEPVIILNGVYLDRKTDLAARKIVDNIEKEFAIPLGAKEILIASQHAGKSNYGDEFKNTDGEYLRLRAIKDRYGDKPEEHTYDDIGLIAIDAEEGRTQDSQALNRWSSTGKHIISKSLSK